MSSPQREHVLNAGPDISLDCMSWKMSSAQRLIHSLAAHTQPFLGGSFRRRIVDRGPKPPDKEDTPGVKRGAQRPAGERIQVLPAGKLFCGLLFLLFGSSWVCRVANKH
ncbi:hypothetical protein HD806DRAFT_535660 [Xylariaceae sp. AK1471]|nr:hypothetical protein HD806DRAFT_535660 [Xylariaceae sp. AK1471]